MGARGTASHEGTEAMMNATKTLLTSAVLGAVVLAGCSSNGAALETVSPNVAATLITEETDEIILDIRTPEEFNEGIIEGAINIDFYAPAFLDELDALDKNVHYVVYCRSGNRSGQAMGTFADLGSANITEIDGGIANWYNTGHEVVLP